MTRFESHLKKNLVKINHNLYVSENDSSYYEKLLRYTDPYSPEAHFHQGQKLEKEGELGKALIHYYEAAQIHSPYYHKAKKSISLLEDCIRLANQDMLHIFDFIPKGTVVNIHDHTPSSMEELILNSVDQLIPKIKPTIEQHTDDVFNWSA